MNLSVRRFNFSSGASSCARPSMIPAEDGEYVLYAEVVKLLKNCLSQLEPKKAAPIKLKCGHVVMDPNSKGIRSTYCTMDSGHEGEHDPW
jgi:hypothetical protein